MKSYIERVSLVVENEVLRDRCKSNARAAGRAEKAAKFILNEF